MHVPEILSKDRTCVERLSRQNHKRQAQKRKGNIGITLKTGPLTKILSNALVLYRRSLD